MIGIDETADNYAALQQPTSIPELFRAIYHTPLAHRSRMVPYSRIRSTTIQLGVATISAPEAYFGQAKVCHCKPHKSERLFALGKNHIKQCRFSMKPRKAGRGGRGCHSDDRGFANTSRSMLDLSCQTVRTWAVGPSDTLV